MELALLLAFGLTGALEDGPTPREPAQFSVPPAVGRPAEGLSRLGLDQRTRFISLSRALIGARGAAEGGGPPCERSYSALLCRTKDGHKRVPHPDCMGDAPWYGLRAVQGPDASGDLVLQRLYLWVVDVMPDGERVTQGMPPFQLRPNREIVYESEAQKAADGQDLLLRQLRFWMRVPLSAF